MRYGLVLAAVMLPLAGCVATPDGGYGGEYAYPGYAYNSGSPSYVVDGVRQPLVYYGGSWGYYDGYRRFHRAPEGVYRHLEQRHPNGYGYRPYGGAPHYVAPAAAPHYAAPVAPRYVAPNNPYRPALVAPGGGYHPQAQAPRVAAPHYVAPAQQRPAQQSHPSGQRRRDEDRR